MSRGIEFRILGPFDITRDGEPVRVAATKHRVLLARLLVDANRVVPVDRLIECLWDNDPPATARAVVHTYVSRLRQALGSAELIETLPNGYRATVRNGQLDLLRFRELVRLSRQARDPAAESALLHEAGTLWRGPALATVPSDALQREAAQLDNEELAAADRRVELDLALGRHRGLVPELRAMVARRPFSERLLGQLMLALHRGGRQAEALTSYQEFRAELGAEPGTELRELHQAILRGQDEPPALSTSDWTPVSQLPPHVGHFVGRSDELSTISALLRHRGSLSAPLVVLSGPPGVGKTALAVHAAHGLKDDFPDGQLYVNLRGYSPEPALTAAQVLPRFLRALGVPPEQVPLTEAEQASLYRTLLSGRRVLVVLDNASAVDQVRVLAPSSSTCATLVTSRNNLGELVALNGAQVLRVDVLAQDSALLLLERIIGPVASPEAASALVDLCGALPLALRIAAANIAFSSHDIESYVDDLRGDRFSALAIEGDREAAVQAAFDLSYATLPLEAQRVFRLLSLVPGTDFTAHTAAALGELVVPTAEAVLQQLATVNLLQAHLPGRYQFHDLIRAYASTLASTHDTTEAPFIRLLDYYAGTAYRASAVLYPDAMGIEKERDFDSATTELFEDAPTALGWYRQEVENIAPAMTSAQESDYPLWHLIVPLVTAHTERGNLTGALALARKSLELSGQLGIVPLEITSLANISFILFLVGHLHESAENANLAIATAQRTSAQHAEVMSHVTLGNCHRALNQTDLAIAHATIALENAVEAGYDWIEAAALLALGEAYLDAGRMEESLHCLTTALKLYEGFSCATQLIAPSYNLARFWRASGEPARARDLANEAHALARGSHHLLMDPEISSLLALLDLDTGDIAGARQHIDTAAEACDRMGRRLARAHAHHVSGLVAQAAGDNDTALAEWHSANSIHTALRELKG
ncbi:NB-ARC domain-containing protein [Allokutzneria sp. A3M-2-11 16]|uniref:AfsR/SARP family transcriptional regulator n=1 Tax=Allokutzneria sp. A3M-2-11 16 TaxID=2962043 RepID=UPI0020B6AA69|nr:BTAD domain-containing putative transcriptional regulator [Allokutzneria sp. A3M-2-11 16]MCP3801778.1 NB-ARC domain-containing protein [Allokutzneria sp. A3M-2-11 16]